MVEIWACDLATRVACRSNEGDTYPELKNTFKSRHAQTPLRIPVV